ncbi:MAG: hypothetical protein LRS49_06470, partial [Desulfurococcales archaeon]|nr:hypothetical protein [Desulfurococcales archaeon]
SYGGSEPVWRLEWARLGWSCRDALAVVASVAAARLLGGLAGEPVAGACLSMLEGELAGGRWRGLEVEYLEAADGWDRCSLVCDALRSCLNILAHRVAGLAVESGAAVLAALASGERLCEELGRMLVERGLAPWPPGGGGGSGEPGYDGDAAEEYEGAWLEYCLENPGDSRCRLQELAAAYGRLRELVGYLERALAGPECRAG